MTVSGNLNTIEVIGLPKNLISRVFGLPITLRVSIIVLYQKLCGLLYLWKLRADSRKLLGQLDGHFLRDVGLSPFQAHQEAAKPFWKA